MTLSSNSVRSRVVQDPDYFHSDPADPENRDPDRTRTRKIGTWTVTGPEKIGTWTVPGPQNFRVLDNPGTHSRTKNVKTSVREYFRFSSVLGVFLFSKLAKNRKM